MLRLRRIKSLVVLLILCMLASMTNTEVYAKSSFVAPNYNGGNFVVNSFSTEEPRIKSFGAVTGSAIYVGGTGAKADNDGSIEAPFLTLKEAADSINSDIDGGSYQIMIQGDIAESEPVSFGDGYAEYEVAIKNTNSVSGSAIQVTRAFTNNYLISVKDNTTLTLQGYSDTKQLIFDGGGEGNEGEYGLFYISPGGTLSLEEYASIKNNIISSNNHYGAGIYNNGTLLMKGGSVSNNFAYNYGGGIYNKGIFILECGTISNNSGYYGYGSGVYNVGDMTINGGTITQNNEISFYNGGTVIMNAGDITENDCRTAVQNYGTFNMNGGSISNNRNTVLLNNCTAISVGGGEFNLNNGLITNNEGNQIISLIGGSFDMTGGTISNNTAGVGVIRTSEEGSFSMSDGVISNNTGRAIHMSSSISLSDNATISGNAGGIAEICIVNHVNDICIDISGSLSNITSIGLSPYLLKTGKQIITGTGLTEELISKFILNDTNYTIDTSGKVIYCGEPITLYVDAMGSDAEERSGSSSEPLYTFDEALRRIGSAYGTIIVQSDLDVSETFVTDGNITIKSDGQSRTLHQKIQDDGGGFECMFYVVFGTLSLGDKEQTEGELIIQNDFDIIPRLIDISAGATVNLYNHAVIQNSRLTDEVIYNDESTFNLDGGSITNCAGTVINNAISGTVNLVSGTISAATGDNDFGIGIVNEETFAGGTGNIINMSGGTITGFNGTEAKGILNMGELNLSGGVISNNTYSIVNDGIFKLKGNVSIAACADGSNYICLSYPIDMEEDLLLNEDNLIPVIPYDYDIGIIVLLGDSEAIKNNCDNIILADNRYGVSETGEIIYIGEPPAYYVDADYTGGDNDGSMEKPFTTLRDAISRIDREFSTGTIYICSDLVLTNSVRIRGNNTIVNNGSEPHTITRTNGDEMFIIPEGNTLSLGKEGAGSDDNPSLILYGQVEGITDAKGYIVNEGMLKLYPGVKLYGNVSLNMDSAGAIFNQGEFHMYGGVITDNSGYASGGISNYGTFLMEGGSINNCTALCGALLNGVSATFTMTGGTIEQNRSESGMGIYNVGIIHISEDASIPMGEGGDNMLCLDRSSYIIIDGDLYSSDKILLTTTQTIPGRRLLGGDENILQNNFQKFMLDSSLADYRIVEDGTLLYIGGILDYYVNSSGNDDNDGTLANPFATLGKAISSIENNSGVGTIHICSNLELAEPEIIYGVITLINEGEEPHVILRSPEFSGASAVELNIDDIGMFIVYGQLELGNEEKDELPETTLLTMDGNRDNIFAEGALISNYGSVILHNGIVLQGNSSYNGVGGIYNQGILTMKGGVIQNNHSSYAGGIYNFVADAAILGGSIRNNDGSNGGGICSEHSSINISGGNIHENEAYWGGGLYLLYADAIISGGVISGNIGESPDNIGTGVLIDYDSTLTVLKDVSIDTNNDVVLLNQDDFKPVITVGGSLSVSIPIIMITRGYYNWGTYSLEPDYHAGDRVIKCGEGYTLTVQDISKFSLTDHNYAINNLGRIASNLNEDWFSLVDTDELYYTGSEKRPAVNADNDLDALTEGTDYQVSYNNNINAGTAVVNIDGMGNYGGRVTKTFIINKAIIQSIATSAPADQTIAAAAGMTLDELISLIPLSSVTVQYSHGTEDLTIAWTLSENTYNPKGGAYTFTGNLDADGNFETEGKTLITRITVTPFALHKPAFSDVIIIERADEQVTASELGNTVLPTSGSLQADDITVNYTITWDDSTLNGTNVGASHAFTGIITYTNAPEWATLPSDLSVSRKVSVTAANIQPPTPDEDSTPTPTPTPKVSPTPSGSNEESNVEVSVTINQNQQNQELNTSISVTEDSIQDLINKAAASGQTVVTIPITSEELTELMQDSSITSVNIDITIPDSIIQNGDIAGYQIQLDSDILEAARETGKDVHISVKDEEGNEKYSWNFAGDDLATCGNAITDLDLSLEVERVGDNQELAELLGQESQEDNISGNNVVINFNHHGDLPAQASVRIYVGDMGFSEGDSLYLYYYNTETGKLETLPYSSDYKVDSEGYVTVDITHCSDYVLLQQQADRSIITSLRDQISITPDKFILYLGSKDYGTATISIKLPEALELVKNLKDKTSGSAIGAVVITYKSSNSKVITVDSSGKFVAKKLGEAVIKVTAKLYSGKIKTFQIPITVKKPYIALESSTDTMNLGDSFTFKAIAYGLDIKNIEWKTTKKSIIVINKKTGKASAVKRGTDYIVASIDNITYQIKVIVK